jgi:gliding motility-associated transport system permease protein
MKKAGIICRRELAAMFGTPLVWVLTAVFAVLTGYFFYSNLTFFVVFGGADFSSGLWRFVFLDFRLASMLVLPLLTMRLIAEERKLGTLELLWTFPVRDVDVLLGKFAAAVIAYLFMLATTLVGPLCLWLMHRFALGPLVAGYTGMVLLGFAFTACGLAASALTENQVVSAMLTYGVLVFFWFLSWNEAALGEAIAPFVLAISMFNHFYVFAQGVLDTRNVIYMLGFTALFLFVALRAIGARAWRGTV